VSEYPARPLLVPAAPSGLGNGFGLLLSLPAGRSLSPRCRRDPASRPAPSHPERQLHHRARTRRRWHVARFRGRGIAAQTEGGGEGPVTGPRAGNQRRAVRARDPDRRRASAGEHRPGAYGGRHERPPVLHDAVRRGRVAPRPARPGLHRRDRGDRDIARRGEGARLCPPARRRAPRHQAGQRADVGRRGHGDRLRHSEGHQCGAYGE